MNTIKIIIFLCGVILSLNVAEATHFRYGLLTWKTISNTSTVQFSLKCAFRNSYFSTVNGVNLKVGDTFSYGEVTIVDSNLFSFLETMPTNFLVNNIDLVQDIVYAENVFTMKWPNSIWSNYIVYYEDGDRLAELNNNANNPWHIETSVPMLSANWTKGLHSSPVSSMMPMIDVYMGRTNTFKIPVIDSENSAFTYALSTLIESHPPGFSINASGVCTYTPTQTGLWSTQIKIGKTNPINTFIHLDFLIRVSQPPAPTATPPFLVAPTPLQGQTITVEEGSTLNVVIRGQTIMPATSVNIMIGEVPLGMNVSSQTNTPQTVSGSTGTVTLSWKPTSSKVGVYVINIGLTDSKGLTMTEGVHYFYINVTSSTCNPGPCVCPVAPGQLCDDGNSCTIDTCKGPYPITLDKCTHTQITCAAQSAADPCFSWRCMNGTCARDISSPKTCPSKSCQTSMCDSNQGGCIYQSLCQSTPCMNSVCGPNNQTCINSPVNCNGNDQCLLYSCDAALGCVSKPKSCVPASPQTMHSLHL
ncbi:hypothetical protein SAMD00019534_091930 [Acytostelium subglobosum LB1]|uniref:hypothetical protein n=1 Tax=Acytostelium subglobosum LB1 TaxID=1410327 RepID=UPI000644EADB|nr:hypothetical protein SAMD00019534_091930 [Acytostelium subglobosum LB1]GAM26018.1 hypothetical protein SAMD00019534_091930 [Acytostelium subglobosum LB1]|eukprot:XP_012751061.1 hypothetical protein SAMD00019534_091930 [Acytostelium subglobosum LB1]